MSWRSATKLAVALASITAVQPRLLALEATVIEIRASGLTVRAAIDIKAAFPEKFKTLLEDGATLHLRVQTELWESRPVWDRLVRPASVSTFRLTRDSATRTLSVAEPGGPATSYPSYPDRLPIRVDVAPADRIEEARRYYLHAIATLGILAEREVDELGDAVFGRDAEASSLGALGKFVFRKIVSISDYLQSQTAETTSKKILGKEIRGA
jgi:hypothetical protein